MASGIIPTGGQYSQRLSYGGADKTRSDYSQLQIPGGNGLASNGYLSGYGDPSDKQNQSSYIFSKGLGAYNLPSLIIPAQRTSTPDQVVGRAQFMANGETATQGLQTSKPYQTSAPSVAPSTETYQSPTGMIFGERFVPGQLSSNAPNQNTDFYSSQPSSLNYSNPNLGTFTPWSPSIRALQQSR